jgi:hypothetical protein
VNTLLKVPNLTVQEVMLERTESNAWENLENDPTKLTASDLTILLTWHQQPKVAAKDRQAE